MENVDSKKRNWRDYYEYLKDGLELIEKLVGGRNALVAGMIGFAIGAGAATVFVSPSDEACAEYVAKRDKDRAREALIKFLKAPARGTISN